MKIFMCLDKVQNRFRFETCDFKANASDYIRSNLRWILSQFALKDIELCEVGEFYEMGADINNPVLENQPILLPISDGKSYIVHSWDEYKFAQNVAENLAPLGLSAEQVQKIFDDKTDADNKELDSKINEENK